MSSYFAVNMTKRSFISTNGFSLASKALEEVASCYSSKIGQEIEKSKFLLTKALKYLFFTLLSDILTEYSWLSYIIVIAIPIYVCATSSLPIAAGLMLSGVSTLELRLYF